MSAEQPEPLGAQEAGRVVELARACRAAARAVGLYPPEHPAIQTSLGRLEDIANRALEAGPWLLTVTPGEIQLGGRSLPRPDVGVTELANLLHAHQIGELVLHPGATPDVWMKFLTVIASDPQDIQRQGGISRVWATAAGRAIEIRELDYGAVLRDGVVSDEASWDAIVKTCLQGDSADLDANAVRMLTELAGDADRLVELAKRLESDAEKSDALQSPAAAVIALLRNVIEAIARSQPDRLDPTLATMAVAAGRFSPEMMLELLAKRGQEKRAGEIDVAGEIVGRLDDRRIAGFVVNSVVTSQGATARLAEAFLALVPEPVRRDQLLDLAREELAGSELGAGQNVDELWQGLQSAGESYSDDAYVSKEYERDLDHARAHAAEIDVITDDPPERIAAWLGTVSDAAVRALDLRLLLDLLKHEGDGVRWREMSELVVNHIDELLLVGDLQGAAQLVDGLAAVTIDETETVRQTAALVAIDRLIGGQALTHIAYHLQTIDDEDFNHVKTLCKSLGPGVIKPLAELLAVQERARVRQRLTDVLISFGSLGRQSAEQLKNSPNASVRRVAVQLLREFGGADALPDLESLLDDAEPHVQKEAVRAILLIGTDDAYSVLDRALRSAGDQSRETILEQLEKAGDERAAPLFAYIVRRGDYRGSLRAIYVKAIGALGRLGGDEEAIEALKLALHRGEWWAPRRTAELRAAAARALNQIGSEPALAVLREASEDAPRRVRTAARQALAQPRKGGRTEPAAEPVAQASSHD